MPLRSCSLVASLLFALACATPYASGAAEPLLDPSSGTLPGETVVDSAMHGVGFTVPAGWTVQVDEVGIWAHDTDARSVVLMVHSEPDAIVPVMFESLGVMAKVEDARIASFEESPLGDLAAMTMRGDASILPRVGPDQTARASDFVLRGVTGPEPVTVLFAFVPADADASEREVLERVVGSLRRLD